MTVEAKVDGQQVVRVISDCRLLDAEECEQMYWRRDGLGVAQGWYVVTWPQGAVPGRFNEDAQFRGPFRQRAEAEAARRRAA